MGDQAVERAHDGDVAVRALQGGVHTQDVLNDVLHIDRLQAHVLGGNFRIVQNVAREGVQMAGRAGDSFEDGGGLIGKAAGVLIEQNIGITFHGADGGAEVVGDGVGKAFQVGDGVAEPGGAVGDDLLEPGV